MLTTSPNLSLKYRIRKPDKQVRSTSGLNTQRQPLLILLHGVGSNEDELFDLASSVDGRFWVLSVRAPFAQSPTSFAWYRISPFSGDRSINEADAEQSRLSMVRFIHEAVSAYDVDASQVYLLGFGQGATIALSVLLTEPALVRGCVGISGVVLEEVLRLRGSSTPLKHNRMMLSYGVHDQVIPITAGRSVRDTLHAIVGEINYREYPVGHYISPVCMRESFDWLTAQLDDYQSRRGTNAPRIHIGHLQLKVRDLDRSIAFYRRFFGMRVVERVGKAYAFLSSGYGHHDLALQNIGLDALDAPPSAIGMAHAGFQVQSINAFAVFFKSMQEAGIKLSMKDHLVSWSIYFEDPDGNPLEVYCDVRDLPGQSDLWQGRDRPLDVKKILAHLDLENQNPG